MKRFKNILLVSDDRASGQATLARAINLATRNQARLTLIVKKNNRCLSGASLNLQADALFSGTIFFQNSFSHEV